MALNFDGMQKERNLIWQSIESVSKPRMLSGFGDPRSLTIPDPIHSELENCLAFN